METIFFTLLCFRVSRFCFGQLLKHQIVAQPPRRIARALLFFQHAEAWFPDAASPRERRDDFAALRIVSAHAAQPQAVFLRAVEDGELLLLE